MKYALVVFSLLFTVNAYAHPINMDAIAMIESSNNPLAYNRASGARGLYQITAICLKHYNQVHGTDITLDMLWDIEVNKKVANWYVGWLYDRTKDETKTLAMYNWGYGNVKRKGLSKMPKETRDYITKYQQYVGG